MNITNHPRGTILTVEVTRQHIEDARSYRRDVEGLPRFEGPASYALHDAGLGYQDVESTASLIPITDTCPLLAVVEEDRATVREFQASWAAQRRDDYESGLCDRRSDDYPACDLQPFSFRVRAA